MKAQKAIFKKSMVGGVLLTLSFGAVSCAPQKDESIPADRGILSPDKEAHNATINSIVATDAYNRSFGEGDVASSDRKVGMFYFVWHGQHVNDGIYDVTKFNSDPELRDELWDLESTVSPSYKFYYFSEPLYGYYCSEDPYVLTKHIELFTMSGVDYISLDLTNISIYEDNVRAVLEKLLEFQAQGWKVPLVTTYLTGTDAALQHPQRVMSFYNAFYTDSRYDSIWLRDENDGKPVISIDRSKYYSYLEPIVTSNLHIRNSIWPFDKQPTAYDDASWMDWEYPQRTYANSDGNYMSVSVAQHVAGAFGYSVNPKFKDLDNLRTPYAEKYNTFDTGGLTNYDSNRGRGWNYEENRNVSEDAFKGTNLEAQWRNAIDSTEGIDEVFVTGWNEWVAYKYPFSMFVGSEPYIYGKYFDYITFCDTCDEEFSRDLEMTKGGYGDNFYLQNMRLTREFKCRSSLKYAGVYATQDIYDADWSNARTYLDFTNDQSVRDFDRADHKDRYVNETGRNDIKETKIANDGENLYIQIKTAEDIVIEPEADNNLNVLLSVQGSEAPSWNGYQFILNRHLGEGKASLEKVKTADEFDFSEVVDCQYILEGDTISIAIPLSFMGLKDEDFTIDLKVADGMENPGDIMDYYINGDSAPIGRLNYRYNSDQIN